MQDDGIEHFRTRLQAARGQDHPHPIVMSTEKCNFRCFYCYQPRYAFEMAGRRSTHAPRWASRRVTFACQTKIRRIK